MSFLRVLYVTGAVVAATGLAMLAPAVVALIYQEWADAGYIALAAIITMGVGVVAWRIQGQRGELSAREGFAAVGLAWIAITTFGMLPYLLTGTFAGMTDAFFETAAGYTTTGASVVADPGELPHGILFWRSLTQWLGGMGIIVLSGAILPLLGIGGVQLARAESPGPTPDRLTPRFRETAKRLWLVYIVFTAIEALLLWAGDMSLFEGISHAFTTMSTGGFSTNVGSMGAFSEYAQWVVIIFMVIAGANFALHFRALRKPLEYPRNPEFRFYAAVLAIASAIIVVGTWESPISDTIRDGVFTTVSIVTTTGFATADYGEWVGALQILIVGLMFLGGMAGSTSGSVKLYRHRVLVSASRADLRRLIHPRGVFVARVGTETVPESVVASVQSFFLLYMFLFMTGTLLIGILDSAYGTGLDLVTSTSAVASSIGNVGPGLGDVGPTGNYSGIPGAGKWALSGIMITGRLEIYPIVLLFTRELWRK